MSWNTQEFYLTFRHHDVENAAVPKTSTYDDFYSLTKVKVKVMQKQQTQ